MTITPLPFGPERGGSISPATRFLRPRGSLYETFPRQFQNAPTSATMVSGTLWLTAIEIPSDVPLNGIGFVTSTTAIGTATHQIFGLFDNDIGSATGTPYALLAATSDDTSTAWAANTLKTLPFPATYTTPTSGLYYAGMMVTAGTPPTIVVNTAPNSVASLPPILAGTSSTGLTTALPNPCIAPTGSFGGMLYGYVF